MTKFKVFFIFIVLLLLQASEASIDTPYESTFIYNEKLVDSEYKKHIDDSNTNKRELLHACGSVLDSDDETNNHTVFYILSSIPNDILIECFDRLRVEVSGVVILENRRNVLSTFAKKQPKDLRLAINKSLYSTFEFEKKLTQEKKQDIESILAGSIPNVQGAFVYDETQVSKSTSDFVKEKMKTGISTGENVCMNAVLKWPAKYSHSFYHVVSNMESVGRIKCLNFFYNHLVNPRKITTDSGAKISVIHATSFNYSLEGKVIADRIIQVGVCNKLTKGVNGILYGRIYVDTGDTREEQAKFWSKKERKLNKFDCEMGKALKGQLHPEIAILM